MKKRVISLFLTVLMMISLFSTFSVSVNAAGAINFEYQPTFLIGGGTEYNIVWKNNTEGIAYVTYTYQGKNYTVYDEANGVVVSDTMYHSVRVPMEHLNNATRIVATATAVTARNGFNITLGASVEKTMKLKAYSGSGDLKIGCFSDLHLYDTHGLNTLPRSVYSKTNYMGGVDLVLLLGDISSIATSRKYLDNLYWACQEMGADGTPVIYVKGNHENRGEWSQLINRCFAFDTGEMYTKFEYGPISAIVSDSGEDKIDSHTEYGDLNEMEHYKEEEYEWFLANASFSEDSLYHISLSHSHSLVDVYYTDEMIQVANEIGVDIHINGHTHAQKFIPAGGAFNFPQLHDGAHDDNTTMRTTLVTLSGNKIYYKGFNDGGTVTMEGYTDVIHGKAAKGASAEASVENNTAAVKEAAAEKVSADDTAAEVVEDDDTAIPTAAGVATASLKAASETTAITVKPVVFDAGKYFNIVWQTTPGIKAVSEVAITYGNTALRYKAAIGGKITTDTTHSVKIPKISFGSATYEAKSRVCLAYTFGGYVSNPPTSYGAYVSSGKINFNGEPTSKQKTYKIAALTNIKNATYADKIKSEMGKAKPDMLVTLGNMVTALNTEDDFKNYLKLVQSITGGSYPVIYLRGEGECTGAYAANIEKYIKSATEEMVINKFYLNTTFGPVSIVGLDTALEEPDNTAKYNGYAAFDKLRKEQVTWINNTIPKSFKGTYNIVFAHADNLTNVSGVDMTQGLANIGTNLVVTGQSGKAAISISSDTYSKVTVGSPTGDNTYGMILDCADNKITVKAIGGDELGSIDIKQSVANDDIQPNEPGTTTTPGNNGGTTTTPGNTSTTTPGSTATTTPGGSTGDTTAVIKGDYDGIAGETYIRAVKEGWYKDYISNGFNVTSAKPTAAGTTMTDEQFIQMTAKLASVNLSLYTTETTNADKAVLWAKNYNIYTGTITKAIVTNTIINEVITALFPEA